MWRQFPRIYCNKWYHKNIAILGDAKASAHFSIGSGTKLAMECAIALSDAVVEHGETSIEKAFEAYVEAREIPVQILQHNADVSMAGLNIWTVPGIWINAVCRRCYVPL